MAKEKKLIKDTFLYGIANFGSSILNFLMLPLYTFYFSPSEYGLWDVVVTTATLLTPFITFELVAAVYRWLIIEQDKTKQQALITTGALTIIRNLVIFNGLAILTFFLFEIPYKWSALGFINVMVISGFIQQCARGLGFNKLFAGMGILQTTIIVALNLFFIFVLQLRVEAFFYSSIIAGICVIVFAWLIMNFQRYIHFQSYSKKLLRSFLTYSIPIIPGAASWWVMTMSDRYFITVYLGIEANGIYAVANKIPALLLMISSVFFLAWKDSAIIEFDSAEKNNYYSSVFKHFFRLMTTSVICLTLLTKPVLAFVISETFFDSWKYIGILLTATLFHAFSLFWSAGFHGAKKTNIILTTSIAGAIINVAVNFLLIKQIGLYAVGISSLLAFLVTWIIRAIYAKPHFQIANPYRDMVILFPLIVLAIGAPFFLSAIGLWVAIGVGVLIFFTYNIEIIIFIYRTLMAVWGNFNSKRTTDYTP